MTGVTCRFCPAVLHRVPVLELDEWGWAGEDGQRFDTDPDVAMLQPDPYAYLAALGDRALALVKAAPRSKPHPPECDRLMAGYSALKVRLDLGSTFHQHCPRELPACGGPPGPEHCGWPAWLRPSGWQCRQCGAALALERAA